jgi:hypothetical protein
MCITLCLSTIVFIFAFAFVAGKGRFMRTWVAHFSISIYTYIGEKPKEEKEKRKETELINVARTVFGNQKRCTYVDLCEQIQTLLDVKERTAKSYIRFMREREIILKDPANTSYFIVGRING